MMGQVALVPGEVTNIREVGLVTRGCVVPEVMNTWWIFTFSRHTTIIWTFILTAVNSSLFRTSGPLDGQFRAIFGQLIDIERGSLRIYSFICWFALLLVHIHQLNHLTCLCQTWEKSINVKAENSRQLFERSWRILAAAQFAQSLLPVQVLKDWIFCGSIFLQCGTVKGWPGGERFLEKRFLRLSIQIQTT